MSPDATPEQSVIEHLTERMIAPESAEEALDRVRTYLMNQYLPPATAILMSVAAIDKWRLERQK